MSIAVAFIARNARRLGLGRYGAPESLTWRMITPRFKTSTRVVFLVRSSSDPGPGLAIKVSRIPGPDESLRHEAERLIEVRSATAERLTSIPRLITIEEVQGTQLLMETALPGNLLTPRMVVRDPERAAAATVAWVEQLHTATRRLEPHTSIYDRLLDPALAELAAVLTHRDAEMIERARDRMQPLREQPIPSVFEHGDLSAPNLVLQPDGSIGVVDWELAEPRGLPAGDLFFALAFVASARVRVRPGEDRDMRCSAAVHAAFHGRDAWARPHIESYARRMELPQRLLDPLFVACWTRVLASTLQRVRNAEHLAGGITGSAGPAVEPVEALRGSKYYRIWRDTLA